MSLFDFYKTILTSLGCELDENGLVSYRYDTIVEPLSCSKKRVVLPTPHNLSMMNGKIAFHPLCEDPYLGESEMLQKIKDLVYLRLNSMIVVTLYDLVVLAGDPTNHSVLSPDERVLLTVDENINKASVKPLTKLLDSGETKVIQLYLKRGAELDKVYQRGMIASFPLLKDLDAATGAMVHGIKLSKNSDKESLKNFFLYLLPNADKANAYSVGSDSTIAPSFMAVMTCFLNIAKQIQKVAKPFEAHMQYPSLVFWDAESALDALKDCGKLRDELSALEGNNGTPVATAQQGVNVAGGPAPAANQQGVWGNYNNQPITTYPTTPVQQPCPAPQQPPQYQQPAPQQPYPAPQQPQYQQPQQPQYQQPSQPQYQQPAPTAPAPTDNSVAAVLQRAQQAAMYNPYNQFNPMAVGGAYSNLGQPQYYPPQQLPYPPMQPQQTGVWPQMPVQYLPQQPQYPTYQQHPHQPYPLPNNGWGNQQPVSMQPR